MTTDQEAFDEALAEIIDDSPASHLLSIPGIYEILSEHFNNDVLARLERATKNEHTNESRWGSHDLHPRTVHEP